ncbi:MAG: S8 family serine peptidase [Planctomycetota bacterium]
MATARRRARMTRWRRSAALDRPSSMGCSAGCRCSRRERHRDHPAHLGAGARQRERARVADAARRARADPARRRGLLPFASGTSAAAPVVAGTVALMLQSNPLLTPHAVRALLQYSAQKLREPHLLSQGAGLLNAEGAVRLAAAITASVAPGQPWLPGSLAAASTIGGVPAYFGCSVLSGDGVVFGEAVIGASALPLAPLWGNGVAYEPSLSAAQGSTWCDALVRVRQGAYRAPATPWTAADWQNGVAAAHVVWEASVEATWYPYLVNPAALMSDANRLLAHSDSGGSLPMFFPGAWYYPAHP